MRSHDMAIRVGTVQRIVSNENNDENRYVVEVEDDGQRKVILCIRGFSKFGGRFNFEEYLSQGYTRTKADNPSVGIDRSILAGDMAIIAYVNGDAREGIILGFINHPGRNEAILQDGLTTKAEGIVDVNVTGGNSEETPTYISEFNGVETVINRLGEYKVTFKGQPTNLKQLADPVTGKAIVDPVYETVKGSSYFQFEQDGSYTLSDNNGENEQKLKIDKTNKKIVLTGGKTILEIDTASEKYSITNKITDIKSATQFDIAVGGNMKIKMTSGKIGIGIEGAELLAQVSDHLQELIDTLKALQQETHIGNLGYPSGVPLNVAKYVAAEGKATATKSKIDSIKGGV